MVPSLPLLLGRHLHFGEHARDSTVRQSLAVHFQDTADSPLLPFVIHDHPANTSFTKWQGVNPIGRAALIIEWDSKANQGVSNGCFGGRELGCNLPQRTLFEDVFLMEDGFVKSYWKCINY